MQHVDGKMRVAFEAKTQLRLLWATLPLEHAKSALASEQIHLSRSILTPRGETGTFPAMSDDDMIIPYRLTNKSEIRRRLNIDREWSLYALADLDDGMFEHCDWWGLPGGLALVFRAIAIRPIFVLGDAISTKKLLAALPETTGYLNLKAHQLEAAEGIYRYRERHEMRRMFLDTFQPRSGITEPLSVEDCGDIEHLYASGDGGGSAFAPFQLRTGFFRGIRHDGELVAVGGVQVASVVVLTELFGIPFEAAAGMSLLIWILTFVIIVPFGLGFALHEGINWRSFRHIQEEVGL